MTWRLSSGAMRILPDIRLVKYSLAVRLTREERYDEAAELYESIHAVRRAPRLRQLATLYREANRTDLNAREKLEARYRLADFIGAHSNGIYFNDALWGGYQRYALNAAQDSRLTQSEREKLMGEERKLKDDQEERWRAYVILGDIARDAVGTDLGRRAAKLGIQYLGGISERFGRTKEIQQGYRELSVRLR